MPYAFCSAVSALKDAPITTSCLDPGDIHKTSHIWPFSGACHNRCVTKEALIEYCLGEIDGLSILERPAWTLVKIVTEMPLAGDMTFAYPGSFRNSCQCHHGAVSLAHNGI